MINSLNDLRILKAYETKYWSLAKIPPSNSKYLMKSVEYNCRNVVTMKPNYDASLNRLIERIKECFKSVISESTNEFL